MSEYEKKYGPHVYEAALKRFNVLVQKQKSEGLSEVEQKEKDLLTSEFGLSEPVKYPTYHSWHGGY